MAAVPNWLASVAGGPTLTGDGRAMTYRGAVNWLALRFAGGM